MWKMLKKTYSQSEVKQIILRITPCEAPVTNIFLVMTRLKLNLFCLKIPHVIEALATERVFLGCSVLESPITFHPL